MRPSRHPDVVHELIAGRAVLIDPAGTELITLNEAGSVIWEALDGSRDAAELVSAHPGLGVPEIEAFLQELAAAGLVVDRDA